MRDLPAGTLTLLFTDIEGSTRLLHALGDRYPDLLAAHRDLLRAAFTAHDGVEVDTQGDAFFYVFVRATQAVVAAVAAQRALAGHPWPEGAAVRVRMGLHTGEPRRTADGYAGIDLHRAARICAAGHGGQVLLSDVTAAAARQALPDGVRLRDLGAHRLKDLAQPEHLYQLDVWGLPVDFPPVRSLDARPNNLPTPPTLLLGREREVEQLVGLLRREDVRLVTLTGAGGSGKTRLALQVATDLLHDFADGAFVVALAPIADPALVVPTIAQALGVKEGAGRPLLAMLQDELRAKRRLLVLDNFEQLLPAATRVGELLAARPGLQVLVTSRAALHLRGEHEVAVPPLRLPARRPPPPAAALSQYAAVELFIERATAVRADFAVTNANAPAVAEICHRLDGLPLAIELAAARVKVLTPQAMLARLEHRLTLLTGGPRDLPARQQTLRATIAWSYDLLTEAERALFRRLAVFVGGWTLDAAAAVCDPDGNLGLDVLDGVASLVDKSLVTQAEGQDGEPCYTMLETIREYATERLEESGEADALRRRHAAFFLALAEETEPHFMGARRFEWLARLTADHDNLRAALAWSRPDREPRAGPTADAGEVHRRLVGALSWFWFFGGHWSEGQGWTEGALAQAPDTGPPRTAVWARLLWAAAVAAWNLGDYPTARARAEASLAIGRELGAPRLIAWPLFSLGLLALYTGDAAAARGRFAESAARFRDAGDATTAALPLVMQGDATVAFDRVAARELYEESLAIGRAAGDSWMITVSLTSLGRMALEDGDYPTARALCEEGLAARREMGDKWSLAISLASLGDVARCEGAHERAATLFEQSLVLSRDVGTRPNIAWALCGLGFVACHQGDLPRATACFAESLGVAHEIGQQPRVVACLVGLAAVAAAMGRWARAARLLGAAQALSDAIGLPFEPPDRLDFDQSATAARAALEAPTFAAAWAAGQALSLDEAIAEALAAPMHRSPRAGGDV
jgi:predicted ATPase/class 3 adenylate cyclase